MSKTKRRIRKAIMAGAALYGANKLMSSGRMKPTGAPPSAKTPSSSKMIGKMRTADSGATTMTGGKVKFSVDKDATPFEIKQKGDKVRATNEKIKKAVVKRRDEGKLSPTMPKRPGQDYDFGFGLGAKKGKMIKASQGYNARLDESLGMRNRGAHSQSLKSRRNESKGMEKAMGKGAYSGASTMAKKGKMIKARGGVMVKTKLNGNLYTETF